MRAVSRTEAQFEKLCTPPPSGRLEDPFPGFGATDAARVNDAGRALESGVYAYRVTVSGKTASGIITVAR